eukprot:CAMPEP_0118895006 /NCGR_PEP_ID=MMETSP1166-20130328/3550_1 /TAXON_ID=1104430 /ORGANISM="Chrysoreinhardia sp, Strain CCMP3193" /LENGTH=370 /DNA_ID=CAMNT_0006833985 /DNA_START=5 /DNA_END=1117 /DNA_ORIENTATION=+
MMRCLRAHLMCRGVLSFAPGWPVSRGALAFAPGGQRSVRHHPPVLRAAGDDDDELRITISETSSWKALEMAGKTSDPLTGLTETAQVFEYMVLKNRYDTYDWIEYGSAKRGMGCLAGTREAWLAVASDFDIVSPATDLSPALSGEHWMVTLTLFDRELPPRIKDADADSSAPTSSFVEDHVEPWLDALVRESKNYGSYDYDYTTVGIVFFPDSDFDRRTFAKIQEACSKRNIVLAVGCRRYVEAVREARDAETKAQADAADFDAIRAATERIALRAAEAARRGDQAARKKAEDALNAKEVALDAKGVALDAALTQITALQAKLAQQEQLTAVECMVARAAEEALAKTQDASQDDPVATVANDQDQAGAPE